MTETNITKELIKQSEELIKQTESMIAQTEANEDITEIERTYVTERLNLTKLTQQFQYEIIGMSEQFDNLYVKFLKLADLNGKINNQAIVIDNILTLSDVVITEGKPN